MPLDGLRAWIGEVERKLGMRTRVFLVLAAIAIGIGGAALYLAIDAHDNTVSEGDVQALQDRLEAQIGAGGASSPVTDQAALEAQLKSLQAEVDRLTGQSGQPDGGGGNGKGDGSGGSSGEGSGAGGLSPSPEASPDAGSGAGASEGTTEGGATGPSLPDLIEKAKKQSEQAEGEQGTR